MNENTAASSSDPPDILAVAADYADRGWPALPRHGVRSDLTCSCGRGDCASPGKHPRTEHGVADATTDNEKIVAWFPNVGHVNVGVATGSASGLIGLDVDPRNGGDESL